MSKDLKEYDFPADLKSMDIKDLELLSYAIRDFLIDKVSKTGGHLASNLGIVELTIALHLIALKIKLYGMLVINLMFIRFLQAVLTLLTAFAKWEASVDFQRLRKANTTFLIRVIPVRLFQLLQVWRRPAI